MQTQEIDQRSADNLKCRWRIHNNSHLVINGVHDSRWLFYSNKVDCFFFVFSPLVLPRTTSCASPSHLHHRGALGCHYLHFPRVQRLKAAALHLLLHYTSSLWPSYYAVLGIRPEELNCLETKSVPTFIPGLLLPEARLSAEMNVDSGKVTFWFQVAWEEELLIWPRFSCHSMRETTWVNRAPHRVVIPTLIRFNMAARVQGNYKQNVTLTLRSQVKRDFLNLHESVQKHLDRDCAW